MTTLLPHPRRITPRGWLVLATVLLVGTLIFMARDALSPFMGGLVLAYLLTPGVRRVEMGLPFRETRPDLARVLAVVLVYLGAIALLTIALAFALPPLIGQITRFFTELPVILEESQATLQGMLAELQAHVPPEVQKQIDEGVSRIGATIPEALQLGALTSFSIVTKTFGVLLGMLSVPVWLFFILKDRERLHDFLYSLFPARLWPDISAILAIINRILTAYIRAQLLLGLVIGVAVALGLTIMGVPFALVLGLIAGITEMIPLIGPILGSVVGIVVTLATNPDKFWLVVGFYLVVQQVENNLLVPRVQGDALELHPAFIIMLLVAASEMAGLAGMLVAAPLAAVARDVYRYLYLRLGDVTPAAAETVTAGGSVPGIEPTQGPAGLVR